MRLVSIPIRLTPRHLLEIRGLSTFLANQLHDTINQSIDNKQYEDAFAQAERIYPAARATRDRHAQALVYLYQAEALYRMLRWEEALEHTRQALVWLRTEVTQVAAYNKAVALYFEGLLHLTLRADEHALQAFNDAQEALLESERFWGFEDNSTRVIDCQHINKWMSKLPHILLHTSPRALMMIVPLYEWIHPAWALIDALHIDLSPVQIPKEVLNQYLPSTYVPLEVEPLRFPLLRFDAHYAAFKITSDGEGVPQSQTDDVLLIEAASSIPPREVNLTRDTPFVRRPNGRIIFEQQSEFFSGIPRILIKKGSKL